jgi:hypothetical protein
MLETIQQLEREIERRRKEIAALQQAISAIRSVVGDTPSETNGRAHTNGQANSEVTNPIETGPLSGASVREAARFILSREQQYLPADVVAAKARKLGYLGQRPDAGEEVTAKSFRDIMRTMFNKGDLARDERMRYQLSQHHERPYQPSAQPDLRHQNLLLASSHTALSRCDEIAVILAETNRPMRVKEIVRQLRKRGSPVPEDTRSAFNSVFGSMKHAKNRFSKVGRGLWQLKEDQ